jgi:putative endonuclease
MTLDAAIHAAPELSAAYVLQATAAPYLYKGACRNLCQRLKDHRAGRVSRTKNRRPLELVYCETFPSFAEARRRELFWKSGAGRAWLKEKLQTQDARVVERQTQGT